MNRRNSLFALIGGIFGFLMPKQVQAVPLPIRKPAGWLIQWDQRGSKDWNTDPLDFMLVHLFVFNDGEAEVWWADKPYNLPSEEWAKEYVKYVSEDPAETKNVTCRALYE